MKKLMLLFVAVIGFALSSAAQNRTIRGTVFSAEDDEPLVGATVMPIGGGMGTATDIDGHFTLNVPPQVKQLRITYVGMHELTVPAEDGVVAKLINSTNRLDEVMVVAYGTAKKSEYTGAASVVGAEQLQDALVTSATSALSGKVAGVQTLSSNGQPGVAPTVRIRGVGSINASSDPLYVVDGLPFEGSISTINPQDIESMTVLKDAASSALYGARGANGVILITTKRAASDRVRVTVDARWGANSKMLPSYETVNDPWKYTQVIGQAQYNDLIYNQGMSPAAALASTNALINKGFGTGYRVWSLPDGQSLFLDGQMALNPNAVLGYSDGTNYYKPDNWKDGTYHNGFRQEYNVSAQAATDKLNFYLSAGYLTDGGLIKNSHFNRLSTRVNVDYQLYKWLKLGTNMSYVYTNSAYPGDQTSTNSSGNAFAVAEMMAPIYPMYCRDAQGNILYDASRNKPIYDYGDKTMCPTGFNRNYMSGANPVSDLLYNTEDYLTDFFSGKWFATLTPLKGLNITGTIGYNVSNQRYHGLSNPLYGQQVQYGGQVVQEASRWRTIDIQAIASYSRTFADVHNFDIMAGYESMDLQDEFTEGVGNTLYLPDVPFLGNTIDNPHVYGYSYSYDTRGYLFRLKYNFDSRYFFMGSFRRDASSRFAPDKRWGNFWSVSAAWDIAKEKFMESASWVDMLKFKASFGQNGNDNLGSSLAYYYAYKDLYNITGGNGVWNDASLYFKGNPDLSWETSNNFNVGFDFSFFNGRLDGSAEFYNRQTSDMLYNKPTSPSLGYSSIPMNIGSMRNYGFEIDLNGTLINTRDVQWTVNANITLPTSKVVKLHPDLGGEWINGSQVFVEGGPRYQMLQVKYAGVDPASGLALYYAKNDQGEEYVTTNASTAYNTNRCKSGDLYVKGYGGFGTKVTAYGFDLSLDFAYQFGGKIYDYTYCDLMGVTSSKLGQAYHKDILDAWTPNNTQTSVPRVAVNDEYSAYGYYCDRWLTSSNYLQLSNITLGYSFNKRWISTLGLDELRIYGSAENVALWTARKGLDPRQGYIGAEGGTVYGPSRVIMGGLRIGF